MIIALIGIDGSGKTTQALLLSRILESCGYRVKYIYAGNTGIKVGQKYSLYLSLPIDIIYHRLLKIELNPQIKKTLLFCALSKLELLSQFLNYIVFILPRIIIYKKLHYIIVADRYVYDYLISSILQKKISKIYARILLRIVPKPDIIFLLDVDIHIAYKRKHGEKSIDELQALRTLYLCFSKWLECIFIDSNNKKEETLKLMLREYFKKVTSNVI